MSKIKHICDVPFLEYEEARDYSDFCEEYKKIQLDWGIIRFFHVTSIYKYKNYFLYQIDKRKVVLGKPNHDYYHTDIQKIARYFKLGEKYKIRAGTYNYEETYLMLYTLECEDKGRIKNE